MKIADLLRTLKEKKPDELFESICSLYASVRFKGLIEDDGDMLLYQFGIYDWGEGEYFELELTRQFIKENDEVVQLRSTLSFHPVNELRELEFDNYWCESESELEHFEQIIQGSSAYKICRGLIPVNVNVELVNV